MIQSILRAAELFDRSDDVRRYSFTLMNSQDNYALFDCFECISPHNMTV